MLLLIGKVGEVGMPDREKVIKSLLLCASQNAVVCDECPYHGTEPFCHSQLKYDAMALLKEQEDEKKRIMKVIWDTLHEGLSIDTVADQDWVYEQIRHRIEDT